MGQEESVECSQGNDIEEISLPFSEIIVPLSNKIKLAEIVTLETPCCKKLFDIDIIKFNEFNRVHLDCPFCDMHIGLNKYFDNVNGVRTARANLVNEEKSQGGNHDMYAYLFPAYVEFYNKEIASITQVFEVVEQERNKKKVEIVALQKAETDSLKTLSQLEKEHAADQRAFDSKVSKLALEQKRSEIEPYLPTVDELAKNRSWGGDAWRFNMPRGPHFETPEAMQAGEQARELRAREADLRDTMRMEGPQSSRAKDDLERIKSLKSGLEASGFIKVDHTEKVSEKMSELLKLGREEGLLVKPTNGD